ncbi:MAG: aromatic ring-hydroxylating dioxygenase subunit alpha [Candidatus Binatia bacterium]
MQEPKSKRWTLEHPELGTGPLSVEPYISQRRFELVRDRVFRRSWLCTGKRTDEIPNPGDFLIENIELLGASVIIVRGKDGVVRGFHNVCKHRGNKLTRAAQGSCRSAFVCGYHGWAYNFDGKLAAATEDDMFFDFEKNSLDLTPVHTDTWAGFIFINFDPDPAESLREWLGEIVEQYEGYPFDQVTVAFSFTAELNCGWGVLRDSQLEGYHLKYLHQRTAPGTMIKKSDPSRHSLDFKLFRRHAIGSWYGARTSADVSPAARLAGSIGQNLATEATSLSDPNTWPIGLNPTRAKDWFFDVCYLFPNYHIIMVGLQGFAAHTMWPKTVRTSRWNARGFFPPAATLPEQFAREFTSCSIRDLWLEDGSMLEGTQIGLESGAIEHMQIQDQEIMIRHAERVVDDMIEAGAPKAAKPVLRRSK